MTRFMNMGIDEKLDEILTNQERLIQAFNSMIDRIEPSRSFLKVKEITEKYELSRSILYHAIKNGEIKAYRPNGRDYILKVTQVEDWIETMQYNPK